MPLGLLFSHAQSVGRHSLYHYTQNNLFYSITDKRDGIHRFSVSKSVSLLESRLRILETIVRNRSAFRNRQTSAPLFSLQLPLRFLPNTNFAQIFDLIAKFSVPLSVPRVIERSHFSRGSLISIQKQHPVVRQCYRDFCIYFITPVTYILQVFQRAFDLLASCQFLSPWYAFSLRTASLRYPWLSP